RLASRTPRSGDGKQQAAVASRGLCVFSHAGSRPNVAGARFLPLDYLPPACDVCLSFPPPQARIMPIRFQCPACGAIIEALDHQVGAEGECPPCGHRLQVPSATQEPGPRARKGVPVWGWVAGGTCLLLIVVCGARPTLWPARPLDRGQLTLRQFLT